MSQESKEAFMIPYWAILRVDNLPVGKEVLLHIQCFNLCNFVLAFSQVYHAPTFKKVCDELLVSIFAFRSHLERLWSCCPNKGLRCISAQMISSRPWTKFQNTVRMTGGAANTNQVPLNIGLFTRELPTYLLEGNVLWRNTCITRTCNRTRRTA